MFSSNVAFEEISLWYFALYLFVCVMTYCRVGLVEFTAHAKVGTKLLKITLFNKNDKRDNPFKYPCHNATTFLSFVTEDFISSLAYIEHS